MSAKTIEFYEFANFRIECSEKHLLSDGKPVPLTPKVYDTLEILVKNRGRLVGKDELMQKLWPDRFVAESNLTSNIKTLRKALGDDAAHPQFIETISRRGYRFIGEVSTADESPPLPEQVKTANSPPGQKRYLLVSTAVLLIICVFGVAFVWVGGNNLLKSRRPKITRLTTSGKVTNIAAVPDGKSIVLSQKDAEGESLWLRALDSGSQTQILPPQDGEFAGLTVSPDGKFAYYSTFSNNAAVTTLSRISISGGSPEQIDGVDADVSVSFSPDGKKIAYTESHSSIKETELKIADADGTNQKVLLKTVGEIRTLPVFRASPAAWSPDGGTLACAVWETTENSASSRILLVDVETGSEKYLTEKTWSSIENLVWQDAENLAFIEFDIDSPVRRIWKISQKTGVARQLTNDLNGYEWLSAAGGKLFTLQQNVYSSLHVAEFGEDSVALTSKQIFGETGLIEGVGWSRDGQIFYNSVTSGANEIWQIKADGTEPRQITNGSNLIGEFAVSPLDDSLVFSSLQDGKISLDSAASDGQSIQKLTDGPSDELPVFSPDGKVVVFRRGSSPSTLWSIIPGANQLPRQLTGYQATQPSISPDGKQIAFHFMDYGSKNPHWKLGLIDCETHKLLAKLEFPVPVTQRETAWNPKNNLLTIVLGSGENSKIALWSTENGKLQTIDNVSFGKIDALAWSADATRLVFAQIIENRDIVSLENF